MGSWEDIYYDISQQMSELKLKKEFDAELKRLRDDDKYKYSEVRDRWEVARGNVIKEYQKRKKK